MEKHICSDCKREFQSAESLSQHRQAKHTAQPPIRQQKGNSKKKIAAVTVILLLIVGGYFVFAGRGSDGNSEKPLITPERNGGDNGGFDEKAFAAKIPKSAIHWHPHVTILIKGNPMTIPANLGLGGRAHLPVHTHDTDNILHWEVNAPTVENMQLGFFFSKIWKKKLSSECILDYCNGPEGTVKMYVNGVENTEFDHYMPKDKDEIKIVFE